MMFLISLAEFLDKLKIFVQEILLMVVAMVAVAVPSGLLVLSLMMRIGSSLVTAIGIEPSDPTSTATSYF